MRPDFHDPDPAALSTYDPVRRALEDDSHPDDAGDLLIALIGWDQTVLRLAASPHERAGEVLLSVLSWLLLQDV